MVNGTINNSLSPTGSENGGTHLLDPASTPKLDNVTLVFVAGLIPLLAVFGALGNILSLVVLVHHRMRSTTNLCLAALAVSDLLLLLHSFTFSAFQIYGLRNPEEAQRLRVITYPVLGAYGSIVCARITTWLTTVLAVERCIAVYFPMQAKAINSRKGTLLAIVMIYIITAVAFLPSALQYRVLYQQGPANTTVPKLGFSTLGQKKEVMVPYSNAVNVMFRFVPLVVLIVVNALIIAAIRRTGVLRRNMSWNRGQVVSQEQNRITIMLLTVSGVFLVCTLPGALNTIVSRSMQEYSRLGRDSNLYFTISSVTYFLETLNSSVNFIIYMVFSTKFFRTYQEIFCCRRTHWHLLQGSLRRVRFVQLGPSNTTLTSAHELQCLQCRLPGSYPFPNSSGAQRLRLVQSSLDLDEAKLIKVRGSLSVLNGNGLREPPCATCCTCQRKRKSRSQSRSHSSESAANQYS